MKPNKLVYKHVVGSGHQINADIGESVECVEFKLRGDVSQTVLEGTTETLMAYSPFIQFTPVEWNDMISVLYREMVDAWNEKHSNVKNTETKDGGVSCAEPTPSKEPALRCGCGFVGEPDSKHLVTYQDVWPELSCPQCKRVIEEGGGGE